MDEVTFDPRIPDHKPDGINPERWLESVHTVPSVDGPPSIRSQNTTSDDSTLKEMVQREDNMKFPPSMKFERPKTDSRETESQRQLGIPTPVGNRRQSNGSQRSLSPVPKLITTDEKNIVLHRTTDDDSDHNDATNRSKALSNGQVIRTTDLVLATQALTLRPPESPGHSFRSQASFGEEDGLRTRPFRQVEFGSSPIRAGVVQESGPSLPMPSTDNNGTASPLETIKLAPDEHGNEIPPDAKWTRINRRLVSPEVLDQDHRRYEAYVSLCLHVCSTN